MIELLANKYTTRTNLIVFDDIVFLNGRKLAFKFLRAIFEQRDNSSDKFLSIKFDEDGDIFFLDKNYYKIKPNFDIDKTKRVNPNLSEIKKVYVINRNPYSKLLSGTIQQFGKWYGKQNLNRVPSYHDFDKFFNSTNDVFEDPTLLGIDHLVLFLVLQNIQKKNLIDLNKIKPIRIDLDQYPEQLDNELILNNIQLPENLQEAKHTNKLYTPYAVEWLKNNPSHTTTKLFNMTLEKDLEGLNKLKTFLGK